jgi:hypothetical protein
MGAHGLRDLDLDLTGEQARQQQVAGAAEVLDLQVEAVDKAETRRNNRPKVDPEVKTRIKSV